MWLPLIVFLFSLFAFYINLFYVKPIFPSLAVILDSIFLSLNAGSVFYFFTTTLPDIHQKKIAKEHAIIRYIQIKEAMLRELCGFLKKFPRNNIIKESVKNYEEIRKFISEDDLENLVNNLDKEFVKAILYNFSQLKEVLSNLLAYNFIKSNKILYNRILFLNSWINKFNHNFDLLHSINNQYDFSKTFVRDVNSFLLGYDHSYGSRRVDDFLQLLEDA